MWPPIYTRLMMPEAFAGWPPPVLNPAGPYAGSITLLSWVLIAMAIIVLIIVLAALWAALSGPRTLRRRLGGRVVIWVGGIVFPVIVLTALLIYGLSLTRHLTASPDDGAMRVRVTGEMWWWRVDYLSAEGRIVMRDANELHIPVGRPVTLELESSDVIHSFWVPRLSGKLDMIPGRRNIMRIEASMPGVFGGQCAEYCGGPHALMGFIVVAHTPDVFERLMAERRPSAGRNRATGTTGARLFQSSGCAACHRIAGTVANGTAGPDLTYVGSRLSLGAGILPNNRGTMMGWIGDSQAIKPGNRMPSYKVLSGDELQALAQYLEVQT